MNQTDCSTELAYDLIAALMQRNNSGDERLLRELTEFVQRVAQGEGDPPGSA